MGSQRPPLGWGGSGQKMRNRHGFGFSVACRIDMNAETSDLVAGAGWGCHERKESETALIWGLGHWDKNGAGD